MKRGQGPGQWTKVLRRGAALFLATVTVWVLSLTADMGAAAETFRTLAESPAFVAAALQAELGHVETGTDTLDALESWQRLVLDQSPTLMAGRAQVSRYLSDATAQGDADPEPPQPSAVQEPDDPEDPHQLPASTTAPDDIVGRTLAPVSGDGYASAGGVYIENRPGLPLDVAALASAALTLELPADGPQVLIMHTHGTEAYTPDGADVYTPSGDCRTTDENYNMIRVGEEIASVLTSMGLTVLHDKELYDYPNYSGAYNRSLAAIEKYRAEYPSLLYILDVHRDAVADSEGNNYKLLCAEEPGAAQLEFVIGSSGGGLEHPDWRENLKLACAVQETLYAKYPTLMRPVTVRNSRYNQQVTTGSLLIEVGTAGNSLDEALAAARLFAAGFAETVLA